MPNILDILARAQSLMNETALNSITPPRAGGIMYDTLLVLNQMQLEGASLLISKIYTSVSAMEADTTPTSDLTGRALKPGQLVVIVTSDTSSSDMGSEYRYNGPGSWTYVGKVGGLPLDTVPTQNSTKGITSGGVYAAQAAIEEDLTQLELKVDGLNLDLSDADVHQVATGSDVDSASGTRLRLVYVVRPGDYISASCSAGKGLTIGCYDTLSKALKCSSGTSSQNISGGVWIPHCSGEVLVNGYLTISLCKSDSSAFSAQDKADFLAATTVYLVRQSLVSLLPEKPKTDKLIVKVGKNLLNPSDPNVLVDYYISAGTITAGNGYTTSGYIPVSPSTTYYKAQDAEHILRYVEYYDSSKRYLSQSTSVSSFTTPSGCAYVRVSMNSLSWAKAQVSLENIDFVPYSESLSLTGQTGPYNDSIATKKYVDDSVAGIDVGDLPSIKAKTDELVLKDSANLLNPNDPDVLVGYYIDAGHAYASEGYTSSGWIPVSAETTYYKASNDAGSFRFVNFYNASKTYLSKTTYADDFTTPANCAYVRVSKSSAYWNVAQIALSSMPYTPYGKTLALAKQTGMDDLSISTKKYVDDGLSNVASRISDPLRGKKWAVLGDSFTDGATSNTIPDGQYAGKRKVYPYFIGNRTGMDVLNTFFASGRTLAFPATPGDFTNSICNPSAACYYQNIPADVDYITIYLGINDSHHSPGSDGGDGEDNTGEIPIGTISDNTTATYYGAWNVVLTWLRTNRPFAHIGIIVSNGCDDITYRTAQIEVAKKYGIPYLDLNGDDRCPAMIRPQNNDISSAVKTILLQTQSVDYDGTQTGTINRHPNDAAHLFESYFIENFLRTI